MEHDPGRLFLAAAYAVAYLATSIVFFFLSNDQHMFKQMTYFSLEQ